MLQPVVEAVQLDRHSVMHCGRPRQAAERMGERVVHLESLALQPFARRWGLSAFQGIRGHLIEAVLVGVVDQHAEICGRIMRGDLWDRARERCASQCWLAD